MEGNEVEKAAEEHARKIWPLWTSSLQYLNCKEDFTAGANWQKERENAELTRASKELDDMTTKYNELSKKYADLHKFAYGIALRATRPKDDYLNEEI